MNAIGDIYEKTCCDKVLFYVANTFLWFNLRLSLCSRYQNRWEVIKKYAWHFFFVRGRVVKDTSCYLQNEQLTTIFFTYLFERCGAVDI